MRVSVVLLGYNSKKYLKLCLDSILSQDFNDVDIIYIDNNSSDDSVLFVKDNYPSVFVIKNNKNLGYTGGHNIGIRRTSGEYVLLLNPDIILEKDYISRVVKFMEVNNKVGAVTGKLLKYKLDKAGIVEKTNIIDSVGHKILRSHKIVELGGEECDTGQYNKNMEVFGVSGAAPMFRRRVLEEIKYDQRYFDEDLFMYKEDVDISWRLRHAGWKCYLVGLAVAYHDRWESGSGVDKKNNTNKRKQKSDFTNQISYRNHLIVILKNQFLSNLLLYLVFISVYELSKCIFLIFKERKTLRGLKEFYKMLPLTLKKRNDILKKSKIKPSDIRRWF